MSECFVEVNMYQGTHQIKFYKIDLMKTKDKKRSLQAYPMTNKKINEKIQAHLQAQAQAHRLLP